MRPLTLFWITLFAVIAPLALSARAQSYQWVDEHGASVYSSELPPHTTGIRDLAVVEGTGALSPLERRTLQIINDEARAKRTETLPATKEADLPASATGGEAAAEQPSGASPHNAASENTRDPCLLSADPRCVEKHADDYDPRWGYAPSMRRRSAGITTSATTPTAAVDPPGAP